MLGAGPASGCLGARVRRRERPACDVWWRIPTMQRTLAVCLLAAASAALVPVGARADEAEVHYRMCLSHKKAGKLTDAERECTVAIEKRRDHGAAYYTLGTL